MSSSWLWTTNRTWRSFFGSGFVERPARAGTMVERVRIIERDILDVAHAPGMKFSAQFSDRLPIPEMGIDPVIVLYPIAVIAGAIAGAAFIRPHVFHQRGYPHRRDAEILQIVKLLNETEYVSTPVTAPLLFLGTHLDEAIHRIGGVRIFRIDIGTVGSVRVEAIGQKEIDRARSVIFDAFSVGGHCHEQ